MDAVSHTSHSDLSWIEQLIEVGYDVVVVDQASFPSDTISTHSIARSGVVQLRRWGLLDEVLDSGAPPIRQVTVSGGEIAALVSSDGDGIESRAAAVYVFPAQ